MPLLAPVQVRATHNILRFRTTVVRVGSPGRILAGGPDRADTTYTIEFSPLGVPGQQSFWLVLSNVIVHSDDVVRSPDDDVIESGPGL